MDLESIVRVFRFSQLQSKADRDPTTRRPPTIKFLAVAGLIATSLVVWSLWSQPDMAVEGGTAAALTLPSSPAAGADNETAAPLPTEQAAPAASAPQTDPRGRV